MKVEIEAIFEDNHFLVVNKPAGVLVHSDKSGDETVLEVAKKYLKSKYNKPGAVFLNPVHRLDRPASGCLILARTSKALSRMNKLMADREVGKHYVCLCSGRPLEAEGRLVHLIKKDEEKNKVAVKNFSKKTPIPKNWKKATLNYQLIGSSGKVHLYLVDLESGRPHQIRAQMSKAGAPIMGDLKYKGEKWSDKSAIGLHCLKMSFIHPVSGKKISLSHLPKGEEWDFFIPLIKELM